MSVSMSVSNRGTDIGSMHNVLFPSSGSFRYSSQAGSEYDPGSVTGEAAEPNLLIWGTDVSVESCKKQFIKFLRESKFSLRDAEMDENKLDWQQSEDPRPLYLSKLEEILHVPNEPYLMLNCSHLKEFNITLYRQLINYPTEVIQIFDMGANELFRDLYPEQNETLIISVRPFNIDQTLSIRGLNPSDIGKLVTISGMITRCSSVVPEMIKAFFKCTKCYVTRETSVESGRVTEPHVCTSCNGKFCFTMIHARCRYIDRQLVKLQESPDDMPAGQTPSTVTLVACADLVDKVSPGDRIFITGVYRAVSVRVHPKMRKNKTSYRTTIDVLHYRKIKSGRLHDDSSTLRFDPDKVDKLKSLAKDDNIYDRLANSLCPSIFGHIDIKKGVLLQLFGGTRKEMAGRSMDPKLRHYRSELNMLLCGDPGTSKSQILQYVHKLVPRGQYTSGKGSSAVGLTAYVTRDIDTRQLVLQTGALVMCDGGICCIDEFDKMSESTRSVLHEVMEQQTLSIAKAGIVCQLNARTSVLAAANPVESKWDKDKNIIDNIRMPDTLLSRFDLIFLLLDPNKRSYDMELGKHLVSLYFHDQDELSDQYVSTDLLKDYLAYARVHIHPQLTDDSNKILLDNYIELRSLANNTRGRIVAYPRNLESLIRLSEAHARMRFSQTVEPIDAVEAVRLYREALKHSSTDPNTGRINDIIQGI